MSPRPDSQSNDSILDDLEVEPLTDTPRKSPEDYMVHPLLRSTGISWSSVYWNKFMNRFMYEVALLVESLPRMVPKVVLLNWGAMYIFRNLAYMRHEQGPRLKDLGFELIPELDNDFWSEVNLYVNGVVAVSMVLMPLVSEHAHLRGIYTVDTYTKFINMQCVGHVLRFFTFISTSLPGPAPHCQVGAKTYRHSISWEEVFTRRSRVHIDPNCGDLIFSGHMFQVTSFCAITVGDISKLMPNEIIGRCVSFILIATVFIQPYFIIAARNHYSVDVVVSSYVAPLLWYAMEGFYKSSVSKNIAGWFNFFVPDFVKHYIKINNPCILQSNELELDDDLKYIVEKYKLDATDIDILHRKTGKNEICQIELGSAGIREKGMKTT